jgi:triacylglycerol esterase/lipase EstA (alpha/beta hydrolase family)
MISQLFIDSNNDFTDKNGGFYRRINEKICLMSRRVKFTNFSDEISGKAKLVKMKPNFER